MNLGRVSWIFDGVAEPDFDAGDGDRGVVHPGAFVVAGGHGAELFELVDGAFDGVAEFVEFLVEVRWPATLGAFPLPVGDLGHLLRNRRPDPTPTQDAADAAAGIRLVRQQPPRTGPGRTPTRATDPQIVHHRVEADRVV